LNCNLTAEGLWTATISGNPGVWAAHALWFAFYNFCRVHKTLRVTPAMEQGIPKDHALGICGIDRVIEVPVLECKRFTAA
jgi:hypothetical protein